MDTPYVLLIEDNPGDARLVRTMFDDAPTDALPELLWESTAQAGVGVLLSRPGCSAVLLDLGLPDTRGLEALATVREHAAQVPIIVLSGNDDDEVGISAVIGGAQDYLVKGCFDGVLLRRALQYATHRKRIEVELFVRAMHDQLTGLPTRALLLDRLDMALHSAERSGSRGVLLFADLDHFKQVNDCHGHAAGDAVLKAVAERMRRAVRESDTVARLGGDEFVVLLPMVNVDEGRETVVRKLHSAVADTPVVFEGLNIEIGASIGWVEFHDHSASAEELITRADEAMYIVKRARREAEDPSV